MVENGFQMQRYVKFVKNSFLRSEILMYVSINIKIRYKYK